MAPFLSAADEVVVQSQTKNSLFELKQPPRLRESNDLIAQPLLLYQGGESPRFTVSDSPKLPKRVCQFDSPLFALTPANLPSRLRRARGRRSCYRPRHEGFLRQPLPRLHRKGREHSAAPDDVVCDSCRTRTHP